MEKKYHILVADDEASVREVLRDLILALGPDYVVYAAADSFEALHMLQSLPLDLALIDIFMPGLNGFELLKEARGKYPDLSLVVITGQPSYNMVLEALRLGATDFLAKPISLAELRKILDNLKKALILPSKQPQEPAQGREPNLEALTQEVHEKIQGQHLLKSLSEKLGSIRTAGEFYPFLTDMALTLTGGARASFFLYDQLLGRMQPIYRTDSDPGADGEPPPAGMQFQKPLPPNCLSLPLRLREEFLGVLHIYAQPGRKIKPESLSQLQLLIDRALLTLENLNLQESVSANLYDTLTALINSLEARDPYSRQHSVRVTHIAATFAEQLSLSPELVDSLRLAGALHDIGKIGIPDGVLLKPGALGPEEMAIIRQHPVIGDNIVAPLNLLPRERALILHHHERWNGTGYPMGLKGEEIPFLSRLLAIADAYDAITSDRPYRQRRTHAEALSEIAASAGSQFDPELAKKFVDLWNPSWDAEEVGGPLAGLTSGQPFLSDQQFHLLRKNFSYKSPYAPGSRGNTAHFPQLSAARSDI